MFVCQRVMWIMRFQHIKDPPQKSKRWDIFCSLLWKQQRIQSPSQPMHFSLGFRWNTICTNRVGKLTKKNNFKPFFVDGVFLIAWSFEKKKKHIFSTVFAPDIQFRPRHSETQRVGFLAPFLPLNVVQKVEANPRASWAELSTFKNENNNKKMLDPRSGGDRCFGHTFFWVSIKECTQSGLSLWARVIWIILKMAKQLAMTTTATSGWSCFL